MFVLLCRFLYVYPAILVVQGEHLDVSRWVKTVSLNELTFDSDVVLDGSSTLSRSKSWGKLFMALADQRT